MMPGGKRKGGSYNWPTPISVKESDEDHIWCGLGFHPRPGRIQKHTLEEPRPIRGASAPRLLPSGCQGLGGLFPARLQHRFPRDCCQGAPFNAEVHSRPASLAEGDTPIYKVVAHFLRDIEVREGRVADVVALLQPTSPFFLPEHPDTASKTSWPTTRPGRPRPSSPVPTTSMPIISDPGGGRKVRFRFPEERRLAYNKQTKPPHYLFGNLLVFRSAAALAQGNLFAEPSLAVPIAVLMILMRTGPKIFAWGA